MPPARPVSRRERIVMLEPFEQGLMATTLRYGYEIRDGKPYFEDIPPLKLPDEMVELAEHILDTKAGHFDPAEFEDRYEVAVVEMLKQKASRNAGEEGGRCCPAFNRCEPDGCTTAISSGRATGDEEGQGSGKGQSAIGQAESGLKLLQGGFYGAGGRYHHV